MTDLSDKPFLEREKDAYMSRLPDMLKYHNGKWTVFKDDTPLGFWDTAETAYVKGVRKYKTAPFLLIQVSEDYITFGRGGRPKRIGMINTKPECPLEDRLEMVA